jgi:membrane protein
MLSKESPGLTIIGLLGLVWSSSGMFGAIRSALNIAWGAEPRHGLIGQKLRDIAAVFGLGLMLLLSMTASIAMHLVQSYSLRTGGGGLVPLDRVWVVLGLVVPAVVSFVAFLLLYRNVPNVKHRVSDVWPGALVAAVLFELGKHGFAFYVAHFYRYQQVNGALGGVMLFMLWTYVASIIMLFGAELASEYEERRHQREPISPAPALGYAVRGAR